MIMGARDRPCALTPAVEQQGFPVRKGRASLRYADDRSDITLRRMWPRMAASRGKNARACRRFANGPAWTRTRDLPIMSALRALRLSAAVRRFACVMPFPASRPKPRLRLFPGVGLPRGCPDAPLLLRTVTQLDALAFAWVFVRVWLADAGGLPAAGRRDEHAATSRAGLRIAVRTVFYDDLLRRRRGRPRRSEGRQASFTRHEASTRRASPRRHAIGRRLPSPELG